MRKKIKTEPIILNKVEIIDTASDGSAVARHDNFVVFVKDAVPGDVADIKVFKKKKNFAEGKAVFFHKYSDKRAEPFCNHFGICGGCKWQHLKYQDQLFFKHKQVVDNFQRIAKTDMVEVNSILASENETYYRNKLEFTFSDYRWLTEEDMKRKDKDSINMNALGFHIPQHFDRVIDIEKCYLQREPSNHIRNALKDFCLANGYTFYNPRKHQGFMRNIIIRNTSLNEIMVIVIFGENNSDDIDTVMHFLKNNFNHITSLNYVINLKHNDTISDLQAICFDGKEFITEEFDGLVFRIGPVSFFQTNSLQALSMYRIVKQLAGISTSDVVYDLYTGTGTIANFVAKDASKVIGVEYVNSAVEDARTNSRINGIENTTFFAGDIAKILNQAFFHENDYPDVIITDPPRSGMHPDVIQQILISKAHKIIYVSCNPATQARDVALLSEKYRVTFIQPIDMFPHTHHVENIIVLEAISN